MYETVVDAIVRATGASEESEFVVYLRRSLQREYLDEQAFIEFPLEEFAGTAFRVAWSECALDRRGLTQLADAIGSAIDAIGGNSAVFRREISERVSIDGRQHWRYVEREIVLGRRAPASGHGLRHPSRTMGRAPRRTRRTRRTRRATVSRGSPSRSADDDPHPHVDREFAS
jgi:hypothetical protein